MQIMLTYLLKAFGYAYVCIYNFGIHDDVAIICLAEKGETHWQASAMLSCHLQCQLTSKRRALSFNNSFSVMEFITSYSILLV